MRSRHHTALADACSPDPDRAGPDASADLPNWLVDILALLLRLARKWALASSCCGAPALPAWYYERPDLSLGSTEALAASIHGAWGNAIAWMCLRRGFGPRHKDWPELSHALVAFGGSLARFRPGLPALGLQWWENRDIIPGMVGVPAATPAADAMASLLSRRLTTPADTPALNGMPAATEPAVSPPPRLLVVACAATGPGTGRPSGHHVQVRYA